nr:hypothetical protein BaRGS_024886 [Batillaria attramentaria]
MEVIDLTLDSSDDEDDKVGASTPVTITPGPSHTSDASSSSGCVSPTVINLDAPSPSPHAISCHSLSASPAPMVVSSSQSTSTVTVLISRALACPVSFYVWNAQHADAFFVRAGASGMTQQMSLGPINLEALSEAEFEEFLHGLSWGV